MALDIGSVIIMGIKMRFAFLMRARRVLCGVGAAFMRECRFAGGFLGGRAFVFLPRALPWNPLKGRLALENPLYNICFFAVLGEVEADALFLRIGTETNRYAHNRTGNDRADNGDE